MSAHPFGGSSVSAPEPQRLSPDEAFRATPSSAFRRQSRPPLRGSLRSALTGWTLTAPVGCADGLGIPAVPGMRDTAHHVHTTYTRARARRFDRAGARTRKDAAARAHDHRQGPRHELHMHRTQEAPRRPVFRAAAACPLRARRQESVRKSRLTRARQTAPQRHMRPAQPIGFPSHARGRRFETRRAHATSAYRRDRRGLVGSFVGPNDRSWPRSSVSSSTTSRTAMKSDRRGVALAADAVPGGAMFAIERAGRAHDGERVGGGAPDTPWSRSRKSSRAGGEASARARSVSSVEVRLVGCLAIDQRPRARRSIARYDIVRRRLCQVGRALCRLGCVERHGAPGPLRAFREPGFIELA